MTKTRRFFRLLAGLAIIAGAVVRATPARAAQQLLPNHAYSSKNESIRLSRYGKGCLRTGDYGAGWQYPEFDTSGCWLDVNPYSNYSLGERRELR